MIDRFLSSLTDRQRQVYDLVVAGQTNSQMAKQLGLSQRTVEIHRSVMTEKARAHGYEWRRALVRGNGNG